MTSSSSRERPTLNLRHSIAPRVLDNSLPTATLVSTSRFSVRVAPPRPTSVRTPTSSILTTFVWRDSGVRVLLAGSFDDWRKHEMTYVPGIGYHVLVTELPPGEYMYRFVVDGRWRVSENDPNLREDQFGEMSHFLAISHEAVKTATPKRFSTAVVAHADAQLVDESQVGVDDGDSDTESEFSANGDEVEPAPDPPSPPPRKRGDADYVADYDDDACGEFDLQADVFEAMKDVAETTDAKDGAHVARSTVTHSQASWTERKKRRRMREKPGLRMLRKVWCMLFGEGRESDENDDPDEETIDVSPTRNQKTHGLAENESAIKKGLKVWFPNEKNFPSKGVKGRKVDHADTRDVIDVGDKALKLHQVEDNANTRQMLGKTLFAQGKYDAALALFSLSVKLREDNGLKYAKTTAIAHTDVASAFIHLEDLKNAEKHLRMALAIYEKKTFSGGRSQLGDVHCFLGVIGDMRGDLRDAETAYRKAIRLYEKSKATNENPNYATAIENLDANRRRQKVAPRHPPRPPPQQADDISSRSLKVQPDARPPQSVESVTSSEVTQTQAYNRAVTPSPSKTNQPPKPLEVSRPAPQTFHSGNVGGMTGVLLPPKQINRSAGGSLETDSKREETQHMEQRSNKRKSRQPKSWGDLADNARLSMPQSPPQEDPPEADEEFAPPMGSYEEMSRAWHIDARKLLLQGSYKEAIDLYTLAIYTRKRHGPWSTRENAETLVEYARTLLATKELEESVKVLKDATAILEKINSEKNAIFLGEVWGNLGSVLDRLGHHQSEALTAHCAGMVTYGRAGMKTDNPKWLKAWKALSMSLKLNSSPGAKSSDEVWQAIDLQIRGVAPLTKVSSVVLHM